jgi:NADPH:quinone reductase-like Zn-dependent oxidoreductase
VYGDQNFVKGESFSLYTTLKEVFSMPKYKPMDLMSKNKSIMGYHLGRLTGEEDKIYRAVTELSQIVQKNNIRPIIDRIFPFTESHKAHSYIQDRKNFGKVLLDFRD